MCVRYQPTGLSTKSYPATDIRAVIIPFYRHHAEGELFYGFDFTGADGTFMALYCHPDVESTVMRLSCLCHAVSYLITSLGMILQTELISPGGSSLREYLYEELVRGRNRNKGR